MHTISPYNFLLPYRAALSSLRTVSSLDPRKAEIYFAAARIEGKTSSPHVTILPLPLLPSFPCASL